MSKYCITTVPSFFNLQRILRFPRIREIDNGFIERFPQKHSGVEYECKLRFKHIDGKMDGHRVMLTAESQMPDNGERLPYVLRTLFLTMDHDTAFFEYFLGRKIVIPVLSTPRGISELPTMPALMPVPEDPNKWDIRLKHPRESYGDFFIPFLASIRKKPLR